MTATSPDAMRWRPLVSFPSTISLSPFSKTFVSETLDEGRALSSPPRRGAPSTCARGSRPCAGGSGPRAPRRRRAVSRRRPRAHRAGQRGGSMAGLATTLAARGARERSAISPKSAPFARRASVIARLSFFVLVTDLQLPARDDVRLRALFALGDDRACPLGPVIISKQPMSARRPSFSSALKSDSGEMSGGRGIGQCIEIARGLVDDLGRLREQRWAARGTSSAAGSSHHAEAAAAAAWRRRRGAVNRGTRPRSRRGAGDVTPRAQVADGGHGQRQVAGVDRPLHAELEALDRRLGATSIGEKTAGEDQRARNRRRPAATIARAPPSAARPPRSPARGGGRARAVERGVDRPYSGHRRGHAHGLRDTSTAFARTAPLASVGPPSPSSSSS